MKSPNVVAALIFAVAVLISARIISAGLESFGRSMEKAAASIGQGMAAQRPVSIPSKFRLDLGPMTIGNGGGGGGSFRLQTTSR